MKYLVVISFICIYLSGSFQSSLILIDFYWNRDNYTERYCQLLDQGITKCRASCYLDNLLEEQGRKQSDTEIISVQKIKITELSNSEKIGINPYLSGNNHPFHRISDLYHFDFYHIIFHPPKT